jgi:glutathione synthase/RimK-type ligase-like ATP-grasp enzyme
MAPDKKKLIVGLLYASTRMGSEERIFVDRSKKKGIDLVMINLSKKFNEEEFEKEVKKCDIIYNNSAEDFVLEPLKTIEEYGKKVIDTSKLYYYTEDKWMFYIKCRENKIPTPETILLPNNLTMARAELKEFGQWPVILKRIYGTRGEWVDKAENLNDAVAKVKSFWLKDVDKMPIIAQEYIKSYSYRVTMIGGKILQTAIKKSNHWKNTGVHAKICDKFRVDAKLRKILGKVIKATKIGICGVDLLKKGKEWVVLEVNAEPGLDFIDGEQEMLVDKVLDYLKWYHKKHLRKGTRR